MINIGVLALQGAFAEHVAAINRIKGAQACEIRNKADLLNAKWDGLILPGGESTAMRRLLDMLEMFEPLRELVTGGIPVYGTCAGMILLAKEIEGNAAAHIGAMDITVRRNAFGRQLGSFEQRGAFGGENCTMTFIRAPIAVRVGSGVEVLSQLDTQKITACRQKNMLVTAFHPELGSELAVHKYFIKMVQQSKK